LIMKKLLTEWRKYLKEEGEAPAEQATAYFDGGIYHGIPQSNLDGLRDQGIGNTPTEMDIEEEKAGVPCSLKPQEARKHGDVVLELDMESLEGSGQYIISPDQESDHGTRITMVDSAYDSGHGVNDMVDSLGTNIPFSFVKRVIFPQGSTPDVQGMREGGFSGVEIASFAEDESQGLVRHWTPGDEMGESR